ncbi:hypothetical protein CBCST_22885 (plasmid) [Clostridium botulinum C str. Stockholm]|nr:hypothetical protein CBCST_22885 [Clostridium botulinum C str. Stockholm]
MITEFATAGLIMYAWDKYKNRDIIKIKKEFNKLMEENKLQYIISSIEKTEIGYKFFIDIKGLGIDKLKKQRIYWKVTIMQL